MEKEKTKKAESVMEIIEDVKGEICDHYCKFMEAYENWDDMIKERCEVCVLNRL